MGKLSILHNMEYIASLKKYMDKIYDRNGSPHADYVNINKSVIQNWPQMEQQRRSQISDTIQSKVSLAQYKKETMDQERRKKHMFSLHKWDFIRMKVSSFNITPLQK